MRIVGLLMALLAVSGCAAHKTQAAPQRDYTGGQPNQSASLFSGDAAILSDADIEKILKFKYTPPKQTRVAVLALGQPVWFGYSDELARGAEEVRSTFVAAVKRSSAVTEVAYLPSLLIPTNRSVPYFREAAARYQADSLVIYQSSCRTYEKYRFFAANTSKSFCNVEAALLDVRTGIVPFTTTITHEFVADQTPGDTNIWETMRKAELNAMRDALNKVGEEIVAFLGGK